jgi:hypothetical protein
MASHPPPKKPAGSVPGKGVPAHVGCWSAGRGRGVRGGRSQVESGRRAPGEVPTLVCAMTPQRGNVPLARQKILSSRDGGSIPFLFLSVGLSYKLHRVVQQSG